MWPQLTAMSAAKTRLWSQSEIDAIANWKGKIKDLKLDGRSYTAIRAKRVNIKCDRNVRVPWKYAEDTILRYTPVDGESRAAYYRRVIPWRGQFAANFRYVMYIAPMLNVPTRKPQHTRLELHLPLARTEEERENLRKYYSPPLPHSFEE